MKAKGIKLSKHFTDTEFACLHDIELENQGIFQCDNNLGKNGIDTKLINALEELRSYLNQNLPNKHFCIIRILSGYRCKAKNKAIGGKENSKHCLGMAVDIVGYEYKFNDQNKPVYVANVSIDKIYQWLEQNASRLGIGGIGYYKKSRFIHCDTGSKGRRWYK